MRALDHAALRDNRGDLRANGAIDLDAEAGVTLRHTVVAGGEVYAVSAIEARGSLVVEDSTFSAQRDGSDVVRTQPPDAFARTTFEGDDRYHHHYVVWPMGQAAFRNVRFRSSACPARDQRGVTRPFGLDGDARCDIGAVELAPEPDTLGGLASGATLALLLAARRSRVPLGPSRSRS